VRRCGNACFALGFFLTAVLVAVVVGTHAGRALLFTAVPEALVAGRTLDALLGDTVAAASCARRPWAHGRALDDGETRALFLVDAYVVAEAALGPAARRNRNRNRTSDAASAEAPTLVAFLFGSLDRVSAPALERAAFRARFRRAARAEWTCTRSSDGVAHAAAPPVLDRHYHALTVVCALPDMDAVGGVNPGVQNPMAALEAPIGAHRATLSIAARDTEGEVLRYSKVAPCRDGAVGAFFAARDRVVAWPGGGRGGGAAARIPLALCTSVGAEDATPRALLPWVVYHRAVGFDAVVVYVNAPRADELIRAIAWSDEGRALVDDGGLVLVPWDFSRGHRAVPFADRGAQGAFFTSILLFTLTLSLFLYSFVYSFCSPSADRGASVAHCLERARTAVQWLAFADVDEYFDAQALASVSLPASASASASAAAPASTPAPQARAPLSAVVDAFDGARALRVRSQHWGIWGGRSAVGGEHAPGGGARAPWDGCEFKLRGYIEKGRQKLILRPEFVDYVSVHAVCSTVVAFRFGLCHFRLTPNPTAPPPPICAARLPGNSMWRERGQL
jgi:hypothetical protein